MSNVAEPKSPYVGMHNFWLRSRVQNEDSKEPHEQVDVAELPCQQSCGYVWTAFVRHRQLGRNEELRIQHWRQEASNSGRFQSVSKAAILARTDAYNEMGSQMVNKRRGIGGNTAVILLKGDANAVGE